MKTTALLSATAVTLVAGLFPDLTRANPATAPEKLVVKEGFKVELLYSVPKDRQGSWVSMCADDKGRLIVSDQYGSLYRMVPPKRGAVLKPDDIEKIDLDVGHAWGMCYHNKSLYLVVNAKDHGGRGLYRVRDTTGDDKFDSKELLKKFEESGGEHGPHAVIPSPDGKSLYVACGNQTSLPAGYKHSLVPPVWGEDQLLPRIYGRGFMKGVKAPRGWVVKTDLDGKEWDVIATGFRNQYDIAFNNVGDLFTYDADMEWDLNTPWYRPTRVNHIISGAEFGWRNGSGKWPAYYRDSFGAVTDIGPGSPTGVVFGYGAKFPAKYQKAFYICDWSFGKLYAVHLKRDGASYSAEFEEFLAGQPLPLTDLVIGKDGAMYVAVGGRRVQSGLYRVTYAGRENTANAIPKVTEDNGKNEDIVRRMTRHRLEKLHRNIGAKAVDAAWPALASEDRAVQYAARVAIEHQPIELWSRRSLDEKNPWASIVAIMALARHGKADHQDAAFEALARLDYATLDFEQRLNLLRAYSLVFIRLGAATEAQRKSLGERLIGHFPAETQAENTELSQVLAYLGTAEIVPKVVARLELAPTQEEQIALARNIRLVKDGWTPDLEERYFKWTTKARAYKGGASFGNFIQSIKKDAVARLPEERRKALATILNAKPPGEVPPVGAPRNFVKAWTMKDVKPLLATGLEGGRNYRNGRAMFSAGACFSCHRFKNEGGAIGPDLTSAAGKFSPHDLVEQIIDPGNEISDQYGSMIFTRKDGSKVIGKIANLAGDHYSLITNLYAPGDFTKIKVADIESVERNPVSMMPPGLINTMKSDDLLDLLAYILSAGDPKHTLFEK